jgi:hypothetical protein
VGALADVPALRTRGVLRFVEEQARDETFPFDGASHHALDWAGRVLEVVLCGWAYDGLMLQDPTDHCFRGRSSEVRFGIVIFALVRNCKLFDASN